MKQAGKSGQVKIVGFDAGPDQIKQLESRGRAGPRRPEAVRHRPAGRRAGDDALNGQSVTAKIDTDSLIVTKDNMNQPDVNKYIYKSNC